MLSKISSDQHMHSVSSQISVTCSFTQRYTISIFLYNPQSMQTFYAPKKEM